MNSGGYQEIARRARESGAGLPEGLVFAGYGMEQDHLGHPNPSQEDDVCRYPGPLPEAGPKSTGLVASFQRESHPPANFGRPMGRPLYG